MAKQRQEEKKEFKEAPPFPPAPKNTKIWAIAQRHEYK
jgi:hypothetical protein